MTGSNKERRGHRGQQRRREQKNPAHSAIIQQHLYHVHEDPDFKNLPQNMQEGRVRGEVKGLYIFLESGIEEGEFVELEHYFRGEHQIVTGVLGVIRAMGDHPLALRVNGQRVRFRGLNWIRHA